MQGTASAHTQAAGEGYREVKAIEHIFNW